MTVRPLRAHDLDAVSQLCMRAFMASVAPTLGRQGIATFSSIASASAFAERMAGDNAMLVHAHACGVDGLIEIREGRHVAMLFVAPEAQGTGVGRRLFAAARPSFREDTITVSASLTSVPAYLRYGFVLAGAVAESAGLRYQPMTWTAPPTDAPR